MKKFIIAAAVTVFSIAGLMTANVAAQAKVPECKVVPVGTANTINKPNSKFTIKNNVATAKVKATGDKKCKVTVELKTYYTLNEGGLPREAQKKYKTTTKTVGVGTHSISVSLPPKDCFYQLDLVRVIPDRKPGQKNEMLGYHLGGKKSCIKTPPVTPPTTPETPETPKEEVPETLVNTGAGNVFAAFAGTTTLGSLAHYVIRRKYSL